MTATVNRLIALGMLAGSIGLLFPGTAGAQTARTRYTDAQAREEKLRAELDSDGAGAAPVRARLLTAGRALMTSYDALVRRYPLSGYSDNALFNAGEIGSLLYRRFGDERDRESATRFYERLVSEYPASSLVASGRTAIGQLRSGPVPAAAAVASPVAATPSTAGVAPPERSSSLVRLTAIERTVLPEVVRVTLHLDGDVPFEEQTLSGPARVFFDFRGVEAAPDIVDAVLRYPSEAVRQIRVGRHPNSTVRVVLDLEGVTRHSVYALYNPFRVVIDCEPGGGARAATAAARSEPPVAVASAAAGTEKPEAPRAAAPYPAPAPAASVMPPPASVVARPAPAARLVGPSEDPPARPTVVSEPTLALPARPTIPPETPTPAPEPPNANRAGGFSIARQLGLGVSRIVIDPGHGGHDPGAQSGGLSEADLTLDIALRLEELLEKESGIEVVLTRRSNVYVPLEERTAIANREAADLFLSIHANASRNTTARGVETYFLSFASSPEAEAVAARENSASAREMRQLPDILKAIALNNKLDESRDFAVMVQEALVSRLRRSNRNVRNLGVKKAPFVVLIGAGMPSVLAEVSFLTNRQELQLLKSATYKQRIAEALHAAVLRYRRSLKGQGAIAAGTVPR